MKKLIAGLLISLLATATASAPSYGATAKPLPKISTKVASKTVSKTPAKTSAKKAVVKKRTTAKRRYYARKKVTPSPSPKPVWPPAKFIENDGVFARVPSGAELVGLLSAKTTLAKTVAACEANACGAVYIASSTSCAWWEVSANVSGPSYADVTSYVPYGSLRMLLPGTPARTITPVFLLTTEPLIPNEALILQTLGLKKDKFYNQISTGKSLRQIAGAKINLVVSAVTAAERKDIADRLASGAINADQASAQLESLPARVSNELTSYNLTVGGINVKCWMSAPTEPVPSTSYTVSSTR